MMHEVFDKLRTLQDILSRKFELENEIHEIPRTLTTKKELLTRLKKTYIEKNNLLEELKHLTKTFRQDLVEVEKTREKYEKQMDLIKTQREYEALDKEIKNATEREQKLRNGILQKDKDIEELIYTIEKEENMIKQQEIELKEEEKRHNEESKEKQTLLDQLKKEEKVIIPGLNEEILFKFERIIKSKSGLGIVPVKEQTCTGCYMILPSQFVNEVHGGEDILFCPYCSRILFFQEDEDESIFFQEDDAGSLADLEES